MHAVLPIWRPRMPCENARHIFEATRRMFLLMVVAGASGHHAGAIDPAITDQPQSATNAAGVTAVFAATASGSAPLSFRWQHNGMALNDWGRISGATSN